MSAKQSFKHYSIIYINNDNDNNNNNLFDDNTSIKFKLFESILVDVIEIKKNEIYMFQNNLENY